MENFFNLPLLLGILGIVIAQLLKVPIHYAHFKSWDFSVATSTGGMPSSHTAGVMALASSVGFEAGFNSPIFAVAAMLAAVVMYDATGIRFHAGQQAIVLNELKRSVQQLRNSSTSLDEQPLKTLLGHKPLEVLAGAFVGALFAWLVYVPF
jgi:uncharacterized protein